MEQSELLRVVVQALEELGLPYLVTGSTATIFYGEPRFTADIDVVVQLSAHRIPDLVAAFSEDEFYLDEESVRRAVANRSQFNIIHPASGLKVDIVIPEGDVFDQARFRRGRRLRPAEDYEATFASPEDVILKKMAYYLEGRSEKHLRDITGVLRISGDRLDRDYLERWVEELGLRAVWDLVQKRIDA